MSMTSYEWATQPVVKEIWALFGVDVMPRWEEEEVIYRVYKGSDAAFFRGHADELPFVRARVMAFVDFGTIRCRIGARGGPRRWVSVGGYVGSLAIGLIGPMGRRGSGSFISCGMAEPGSDSVRTWTRRHSMSTGLNTRWA